MKTFIVIIFFLIGLFGEQVFAQSNQPPLTLTLAQQQEDFKIFRGALEEIHAGLNWHISEKDLSVCLTKHTGRSPKPPQPKTITSNSVASWRVCGTDTAASRCGGKTALTTGWRRWRRARNFCLSQSVS
jgi:hypothetical protein